MFESIGIIGSVVIIIAFTFKDEKKIRIADGIGAGFFILYGLLIKSFSTVLLNSVLIFVHVINLRRIVREEKRKKRPATRMDNA